MKKIIIFTNTDSNFYAHLMPIAIEAKNQGYDVKILTDVSKFKDKIEEKGFEVIPIVISRSGINPFADFILFAKLLKVLKEEKPDIIHNFTIKPIFYGTIAAVLCKIPKVINNFIGMGMLFISNNILINMIRMMITRILSIISYYKKILFIVQNKDDQKLLEELHIDSVVQCSVGVDIARFHALEDPKEPVVFALLSRMIVDKGIYEFIEAAKYLKQKGAEAEFWLVGEPDKDYQKSISEDFLKRCDSEGYVKYWGYQDDIEKIWKDAHVAVLPSYREGLSRSLLEAGAYGRAIITTNAPGGRELIEDQINGILVKVKDVRNLANGMELLIDNPSLRKKLGKKIRQDILEKYDSKLIAKKMVNF